MQIIKHPSLPEPEGHYSPLVQHGETLYVSGQLPIDPVTKELPEGIEAQTAAALENVERYLKTAGVDRNALIQVRIYVVDVELWPAVNSAYAEFMGEHKPARVVVPCGALHHGCLVEIEACAAAPR